MFTIGQKIVCINDDFSNVPPRLLKEFYMGLPEAGDTYTVRGVYIGRSTQRDNGQAVPEIGVLLNEIKNPVDPALKKGLNGELGYNAERFAPITEETDSLKGKYASTVQA